MKLKFGVLFILSIITAITATAEINLDNEAIIGKLKSYMSGTTAFAQPKIDKVSINDTTKTVTVDFTESAAYIPMTTAQVSDFKSYIASQLPAEYNKYSTDLRCGGKTFESLATDSKRKYVAPKEKTRFVSYDDAQPAPKGLDGTNIAIWQSHGRYYSQKLDQWVWQRPNLYQTCEDLFTQSFVMPFLNPMLQNAGAYVLSPLERDVSVDEYIVDGDNSSALYIETAPDKITWETAPKAGFAHAGGNITDDINPFEEGTARIVTTPKKGDRPTASWNVDVARPGEYAVYVSYQTLPNSTTDALYTVNAANGAHRVHVNQRMGGGTWVYLGHYPFNAGVSDKPLVEVTNASRDTKSVLTADAVKIGGGMGNVARSPQKVPDAKVKFAPITSGYPRFTEGSRYWLQWAGAPDSVYSQTNHADDYTDDYCSRGRWVNWLAGGSSVLPDREGLNIPVDLSFAFHSDAGITPNDDIIGTLGIYYTNDRESYANGTDRLAARDLVNDVMTYIVDDVRATYEPQWTRRGMWDKNYAEARVSEAPAMLLELLSHQNLADMKYGNDPGFRFVVARAIYKGMLKYIANRDKRPFVVQPLPVKEMSLTGNNGNYRLQWSEFVDKLEPTATPAYYIVEERVGDAIGFTPVAKVTTTAYDIKVSDNDIHSYRVIAGNDGGVSFPSEVLALCDMPGKPQIIVVNGFTRVSAPDSFDDGERAGFDSNDPGVPYIYDIAYSGEQYEFRRNTAWYANERAGMGASRSDFEGVVLPGNTFDFVYLHGKSIVEAGCGFISSSADAFAANGTDAAAVDLILGNQKEIAPGTGRLGSRYKTFPAPLQQQLRDYTAKGGNVMVSGSFIATDLWNNPFSDEATAAADKAFANEVLGYSWTCGNAAPNGTVKGVRSRYSEFDSTIFEYHDALTPAFYAAVSVDAISGAAEGAVPVLRYKNSTFTAGTAYQAPTHKAVAIGMPFETITTASARNDLMHRILKFFNLTK